MSNEHVGLPKCKDCWWWNMNYRFSDVAMTIPVCELEPKVVPKESNGRCRHWRDASLGKP